MNKTYKKGFTLVELVIVIAVIGILAAVLIPTFSGAIDKANKSKDISNAKNWTTELNIYCIDNSFEINNFTGIDVKTYLLNNGCNLVTNSKNTTYIYRKSTRTIEVINLSDINSSTGSLTDLLEITEDIIILGEGNSIIEQAISSLCYGNYSKLINLDSNYSNYVDFINNNYGQTNTIFVTPMSIIKSSNLDKVKNVILCAGVWFIPNISELNTIEYDSDYRLYNKHIRFIIAGAESIANKFNIDCNNIININALDTNVIIKDKNGVDISNNTIVNLQLGYEGIYYYLYDVNNPDYKISITFLHPDELTDKILTKSQLVDIKIEYDGEALKAESYSKIYTSATGSSLYKKSIVFFNNDNVVAYKEIYYIV